MTETAFGKLTVKVREQSGKGTARKLRSQGLLPAVMYGKGKDNLLLTINPRDLRRAMDPERKLNTFFTLTVESSSGTTVEQCVVTDFQADPLRDEFLHVDFLRVDPESEIVTKIPVEYTGRAVGVVGGGKLRTLLRTVRIAAKPAEVPVKLVVDVTPLDAGKSLRMSDLSLPNARLLEPPDIVVAQVEAPRVAKAVATEEKKPAKKK